MTFGSGSEARLAYSGLPATDLSTAPDGIGSYMHFERGSIYFSPGSGVHEVHGAIREKWSALGWEASFLGYPTADETPTPDTIGRFNHFQNSSIYWTEETGAHEVHGAIRAKWAKLGWEQSYLGYPISSEKDTPDGRGRMNSFQKGRIEWDKATGRIDVHTNIEDVEARRISWRLLGRESPGVGHHRTRRGGDLKGIVPDRVVREILAGHIADAGGHVAAHWIGSHGEGRKIILRAGARSAKVHPAVASFGRRPAPSR